MKSQNNKARRKRCQHRGSLRNSRSVSWSLSSEAKSSNGRAYPTTFLWCLEHWQSAQRDHELMDEGKYQTVHSHFCTILFSINTFLSFFLKSVSTHTWLKSTGVLSEEKDNQHLAGICHKQTLKVPAWEVHTHLILEFMSTVFQILPEDSLLYQTIRNYVYKKKYCI